MLYIVLQTIAYCLSLLLIGYRSFEYVLLLLTSVALSVRVKKWNSPSRHLFCVLFYFCFRKCYNITQDSNIQCKLNAYANNMLLIY